MWPEAQIYRGQPSRRDVLVGACAAMGSGKDQ